MPDTAANYRMLHTMIRVKDLDRSLAFYPGPMGMKMLRKREGSPSPQEFSGSFVRTMMDRQDRCYEYLDKICGNFRDEPDLGQIAVACACATSDFRFPEDDWRNPAPRLAKWYDSFAQRPSMQTTMQGETPR